MKLIPLLLIGILTLTTIFFYANYQITKTEYHEYRNGIFTRAYESILSDLTAYLKTEDEAIASRVVARLSELPLSDGEIETARKLANDMTAGAYDPEAKSRALTYAEGLLRYLSGHRTKIYADSWRAAGMGLPAYPEADLPVAAIPDEPPDLTSLRRKKATRLLGNKSLIAYTREEDGISLYGYRTASSYVEMTEEGRLYRMLRLVSDGDAFLSEEEAVAKAKTFLDEQGYHFGRFTAAEPTERDYRLRFWWDDGEAIVGVSASTGEILSFQLA